MSRYNFIHELCKAKQVIPRMETQFANGCRCKYQWLDPGRRYSPCQKDVNLPCTDYKAARQNRSRASDLCTSYRPSSEDDESDITLFQARLTVENIVRGVY